MEPLGSSTADGFTELVRLFCPDAASASPLTSFPSDPCHGLRPTLPSGPTCRTAGQGWRKSSTHPLCHHSEQTLEPHSAAPHAPCAGDDEGVDSESDVSMSDEGSQESGRAGGEPRSRPASPHGCASRRMVPLGRDRPGSIRGVVSLGAGAWGVARSPK